MTRPARKAQENGFIFIPWFFRVFPWLIIKIRIIRFTPHARQLPGALNEARRRENSRRLAFIYPITWEGYLAALAASLAALAFSLAAFSSRTAWAAASLATGTRKGLQLT